MHFLTALRNHTKSHLFLHVILKGVTFKGEIHPNFNMFCLKIIKTFFEKILYASLKQIVQKKGKTKTKQNKTNKRKNKKQNKQTRKQQKWH